MKDFFGNIVEILKITFVALVLGIGVAVIAAPTSAPPAANKGGFLTTGPATDSKENGLALNTGASDNTVLGLQIAAGNVGVRTGAISSGLQLDVEGPIGAQELCDAAGLNCKKVWEIPSVPPGLLLRYVASGSVCPTGWETFTPIAGTYPQGAAQMDTDGTPAFNEVGYVSGGSTVHNHAISEYEYPKFDVSCPVTGCSNPWIFPYPNAYSTNNQGADPPVPDYTVTLYCRRTGDI